MKYFAASLAALFPIALAAQNVQFDASLADAGLQDLLRSASVSLTLPAEENAAAQDYVAAARADYRRLLTALYADGYYGGTISIKIDGREASTLA
jgi:translocation and assembly module TamA